MTETEEESRPIEEPTSDNTGIREWVCVAGVAASLIAAIVWFNQQRGRIQDLGNVFATTLALLLFGCLTIRVVSGGSIGLTLLRSLMILQWLLILALFAVKLDPNR